MRKICFLILICLPGWLHAQVTISVQLPPGGMIQKDQLWNLVAMNNGNASFDAVLLLSLQEVSGGQTVLTASTRSITLPPGVKMIRAQDLQPVQYNYTGAGFEGLYVPLGSYTACYTVSRTTAESQEPVATECVRINITPLSPPLLNMPADKSVIETPYPQFSWTPPAPLDMFTELSYDLNLVELLEGQSPAEAITNNTPLYSRSFLRVPYESYATTYSRLEKNKTYAWQVTARNGMNYAATTDVWTFKLPDDSVANEVIDKSYIQLRNSITGGAVYPLQSNSLRVKYYSYEKKYTGQFRFYNSEHALIKEIKKDILYGDNFIVFELDKTFEKGKVYRVELADQQKNISTIFLIIQ